MSPADKWILDNKQEMIYCKRTHCNLTKHACLERQKQAKKKLTANGFTSNGQFLFDSCYGCPEGTIKSPAQIIQQNVLKLFKTKSKGTKLTITDVLLSIKRTQGDVYIKEVINKMIIKGIVKCQNKGKWRYLYL